MRCLPPLVVGSRQWVLPFSDASAAAIAEWLLGGGVADAVGPLESLLRNDPPLLLWTTSQAAPCSSVAAAARWLAANVWQVLRWPDDSPALPCPDSQSQAEAHADRVAAALQTADLAAQLAVPAGEQAVEEATLLGLLHDTDAWLDAPRKATFQVVAEERRATFQVAQKAGPVENRPYASESARAAVALAVRILAGEVPLPEGSAIDVAACRQRAAEGRRRWLAPQSGPADWLPLLARKLARLGDLESQFHDVLEKEKLESLAEFAAGAGHEINNPLTVIAGRAQLFLKDESDPERRRSLALISTQAMRVYEMIADMMLFARPPRPELQPVEVVSLIDGLIEELAPAAARHETAIRRVGDAGPVHLQADPTQLAVALRALCQNALEAIGHGGQIEIALDVVSCGEQCVTIRISDDGPGIAPEQRRHIFDPFYSARQAGRGLGLGLSKCWRIITNHGGRIEVASQSGHGAAFTIRLPLRQTQPPPVL